MKKLKMARGVTLTFEERCNKYLEYCRQRNLRQGTINHYMRIINRNFSANSSDTSFTETSKRVIMFSGNTQMMVSYSLLAQASALCLLLGAARFVVLRTTLAEQSSSARLQVSLQTRSASII